MIYYSVISKTYNVPLYSSIVLTDIGYLQAGGGAGSGRGAWRHITIASVTLRITRVTYCSPRSYMHSGYSIQG